MPSYSESLRVFLPTPYDPTNHPSSRLGVFYCQLPISSHRTIRWSSEYSRQRSGFVYMRHTSISGGPSPAQSGHVSWAGFCLAVASLLHFGRSVGYVVRAWLPVFRIVEREYPPSRFSF